MANLYMGRGGMDGLFGGSPMPGPMPEFRPPSGSPARPVPQPPIRPGIETPQPGSPASIPPNVLPAQAVRPTGPSSGYDPSYLQNLATSIGGLFSRPKGNLSFNPLGDLSEISPASGQMGNAPLAGEPSTWLQDALNGIAFMFKPPTPPVVHPPRPTGPFGGGGGNDGGGGRGRRGGPNVL